ncbi:MAG: hypothetical protein ACLUI3_06645 [Christensenellales bacterium]
MTSGVADVRRSSGGAGQAQPLRAGDVSAGRMSRWSKSQSDSILPAIERGVVLHRLDDGIARLHDPGHRDGAASFSFIRSAKRT